MTKYYTNEEKDEIVEAIYQRIEDAGYSLEARRCLYCAHFTALELFERGRPAVLMAGDAVWRRIPVELDDGVMSTHFGYEWSPDTPQSIMAVKLGALPEIHIWAALLDTREMIDLSTGWWLQAARASGYSDWPAPEPPRYYWSAQQPAEGRYSAIAAATIYACQVAHKTFGCLPYLESLKVKEHA